jgi:hypothetical protein
LGPGGVQEVREWSDSSQDDGNWYH